jgi:hypothetical protein
MFFKPAFFFCLGEKAEKSCSKLHERKDSIERKGGGEIGARQQFD